MEKVDKMFEEFPARSATCVCWGRVPPCWRLSRNANDRRVNATCNAPWVEIVKHRETGDPDTYTPHTHTHTHTCTTAIHRYTSTYGRAQSRRRDASWQRSHDRRLAKATVNSHRYLYMYLCVCACACVCVSMYVYREIYVCTYVWSYNDDSCRTSAAPSAHCTVNLSVSRSLWACVCVCVWERCVKMGCISKL